MVNPRVRQALTVAAFLLFTAALHAEYTVTSMQPSTGLVRGGEIVRIHGTNLLGPALACPGPPCSTYVRFGIVDARVLNITPSEIVVVAPPHEAGRVDVQVNVQPGPPIVLPSAYLYIDPPETDRVQFLVPIAINAGGVGGTQWQSELTVHNENAEALPIGNVTVPPLATQTIALTPPAGSTGTFIDVPKRLADNMTATLRVHDTTRDADSWGTEVPVVPETQFRRSVVLLGVPTDARYRTLLRVYADAGDDIFATVTFRNDATGEVLATRTLITHSGYAQLAIDVTGAPRLRVQVSSETSTLWAFVSVTNNVTQQVTTITPAIVPAAVSMPEDLLTVRWGGDGVCVNVASEFHVSNGCGSGTFAAPIISADGHFESDGTYSIGGGAGPSPSLPAHLSGIVQGDTMALTIRSGGTTYGPFTLKRNNNTPCPGQCP